MKILVAIVDKRPSECSACPICVKMLARAPCGKKVVVRKDHAVQVIKVPDHRCRLKVRKDW